MVVDSLAIRVGETKNGYWAEAPWFEGRITGATYYEVYWEAIRRKHVKIDPIDLDAAAE